MAKWQFSLVDYTTNPAGVTTNINEPVGWDAVNLTLRRDPKWHGFFMFEDDSFSGLQYDGRGMQVLMAAYTAYGVTAKVQLQVSYQCDDEETPDNVYLGTFDFTTFKSYTADRCYVEVPVFLAESYNLFKERDDQDVDLDSLASYDQEPVAQTITCNAFFQAASSLISQQSGTIRVTQLLNGLLAGSKITITGSAHNNGTFTVASAKPDYTNVNADLAGGGQSVTNPTVSATYNPANGTISINQLINLAAGQTITISDGTFPAPGPPGSLYDNSGAYLVTAVQQFFNYTVLTVTVVSISSTTAVNGSTVHPPNGYMAAVTSDTVVLSGDFIYTAQPTNTIITVAEGITTEASVSITLVGQWLQNNLKPYTGLGKIITLPAKEIIATSLYQNSIELSYQLLPNGKIAGVGVPYSTQLAFTPAIPNVISDIDETDVGTASSVFIRPGGTGGPYNNNDSTPANAQPDTLIFFRQGSLACSGFAKLKYNINYQFNFDNSDPAIHTPSNWDKYANTHVVISFQAGPDPTNLSSATEIGHADLNWYDTTLPPMQNVTGEIDNIVFPPGYYLWIFFLFENIANVTDGFLPRAIIGAGTTIEFEVASQCAETPCSVYLLNEAMSRTVESYTNGDIQVYSDYFGRANAQPVASPADGCGALAAITNGLRVRGCTMPDSSSIPKFFTSFAGMFDALDAIHNIGTGLEDDPNRPGKLRLRVEPFEFFFKSPVLLTCDKIMSYTREGQPSMLPSSFKVGYQQFETWNNNGLYDIFGSRSYRTPLNQLTNPVDKTSKWMASDYAIEFTRRQFGVTTADSRYDASTFILCLKDKFNGPAEFVGSCFMIYFTSGLDKMNIGDHVTITGAANSGNNISGVISHIQDSLAPDGNMHYVYVTGITFVNEYAANGNVVDSTNGFTYPLPVFFIGPNGAMALIKIDLFEAERGDQIIIGNTTAQNGTYTIDAVYDPAPSVQLSDPVLVFFPMIVFTTTAFTSVLYEADPGATINDTTNQFYIVEQGVTNGTNILSPDTVMNYRISPAHNALRHYRNIIQDRNYAAQRLIFTGGEGNFYALGTLSDACSPEGVNISEGGDLSLSTFTDPADGTPLFYAELVKFDYPLSWSRFLAIQANPYGLVEFQHSNEGMQQGWINELNYNPYTGMATFTLLPKIP